MEQHELKDLIDAVMDERWAEWSRQHPHLAQAIDRTRLVTTAVARLRDDPQFITAMAHARADQTRLAGMARLIRLAEAVVNRLLPI